jgi:transposase
MVPEPHTTQGGPVMEKGITYVGMDVHKKTINVAMLRPGEDTPEEWRFNNDRRGLRRFARKVRREAEGEVRCCYEAGPCGYVVQRVLGEEGFECVVVAPSLIPVKPGERVKTDRRDAKKLAELFRGGMLTEVCPPTPEEEAVRDLCRCREQAKKDLTRSRHRLTKMLLRRGLIYGEGKAWTQKHRAWLRSIRFEHMGEQATFDDYLLGIEQLEERVKVLGAKVEEVAQSEAYREHVGWLRCFRGIDTVTAMTILAELHGVRRFGSPYKLMSYLGLVPSERSSGETARRGGITKAGNSHVRRVLTEAAWQYRHKPALSQALRKRREGQPAWVIGIADRAQSRLHHRYWHLIWRGNKPANKATTAVARELIAFIWAVLYLHPESGESAVSA